MLHYGGYPADMEPMLAVAERHGWYVIEDAAHAPGARLGGAACGTIGDAGCFSFFPNKNMTTGEGGMVVLRDPAVAARARSLRSHAMTTMTWDRHRGHAASYDVVDVGFNYRIDEMRAALGRVQLSRLDELNAARERVTGWYRELLAGADGPLAARSRRPRHARRTTSRRWSHPRSRRAIACGSTYASSESRRASTTRAIHRFRHYASERGLPNAEAIADRTLTLPLHPGLSREDVETVCAALLDAS